MRGPRPARLVVVYADFECPFCAALELRLRELPLRVAFRHFPVRSSHPRAWPAARAAEAAALQGRFWEMHDALFADQGRLEDPHLWERAERLGLDVARFDADRRSEAVEAPDRRRLPRRRARRRGDHADAVRRRRAPLRAPGRDGAGRAREPAASHIAYTEVRMATDAQLIERLRTDATGEALRELYRAYSGELFGFSLNALGERGAAEELVQEVFTRAWRHAERYDPDRASVRTWLYQIARHAIIDARRRAAVRPGLPLHEPGPGSEPLGESVEQAMLGWQVAMALERLSPDHRQMIRLAHVQGLTMREIAEHTDLPVGTVKSRTWYALRALRLVLEEMGIR